MAQAGKRDDNVEMVALFSSTTMEAELEANNIHALMEANGIPSVVVGSTVLPIAEFQVQVPADQADEARRILEEAEAAGPQAAAEAEAGTEEER